MQMLNKVFTGQKVFFWYWKGRQNARSNQKQFGQQFCVIRDDF